jgi:hypothetical protein
VLAAPEVCRNEELDSLKFYAPVNLFKCALMLFLPSIYEQEAVNDGAGQQEKVG